MELWQAVDDYCGALLPDADPDLDAALAANAAAGLLAIDVSPAQGRLLNLLARSIGASRILEVGTLGGYSTIWLARALPAVGLLTTCEIDPRHAEVAAAEPRVDATVIQTVGSKGHDGFALAVVRG